MATTNHEDGPLWDMPVSDVSHESKDFQIGYHEARARRAERALVEARAEVARLRELALDVVTTLEEANDSRSGADLREVVADEVERLADGRFPPSKLADTSHCPMAMRCLDALPVCESCKATVAA